MKGLNGFAVAAAFVALALGAGCGGDSLNGLASGGSDDEPDTTEAVYITDRTGKQWEISHAISEYGMLPENFNYGLGPNAIRPIIHPAMLSQGDPGYPADDLKLGVLGVSINGDSRAYPIGVLSSREVVNDRVGGEHIAAVF
jgi:hypothetical protein